MLERLRLVEVVRWNYYISTTKLTLVVQTRNSEVSTGKFPNWEKFKLLRSHEKSQPDGGKPRTTESAVSIYSTRNCPVDKPRI